MSVYTVLVAVLYATVVITLVSNLFQLFVETKQLKAAGKTPLVSRNLTTVILAAVAEAVVISLVIWLYKLLQLDTTVFYVVIMYILAYTLRNVGAYLAAWGLWSIFIRIDKKKLLKQIEKEKAGAL